MQRSSVNSIKASAPGRVRDDILAAIRKESWAAGAIVDIVVTNREVQMWGVIVNRNQRNALKALIENVVGTELDPRII